MFKQTVFTVLREALQEASQTLNLPEEALSLLKIERPRLAAHGHFAINVSPLAKWAKLSPPAIAAILQPAFEAHYNTQVISGYINVSISHLELLGTLVDLIKIDLPGQNKRLADTRCLMEFVSANPTGPLHIGHGRWVALGDSLGRLLRHSGALVDNEFYINDAGVQMENIAQSLWYRALECLETGISFPEQVEGQPYPYYAADYVVELAQQFLLTHRDEVLRLFSQFGEAPPAEALALLKEWVKTAMLEEQKALMAECGLEFDTWFSETTLHQSGQVEATLTRLKDLGKIYEKEGALWFRSTEYQDDQDRVLIKQDGHYTYLTADIAYHDDKFRRNHAAYNTVLNIWGADHHGYIPRMKAAVEALGHDPKQLEIILGQLVNLLVDGERARMGKRKKMLTLAELLDEVGVDALRFWMVSKSQDTALDFNVDLAASKTDENPVFYVQYAHARCCSIIRHAGLPRFDSVNQVEHPPILTVAQWQDFLDTLQVGSLQNVFETLENEAAHLALTELILKLDAFEDKVVDAAQYRSPHLMARYLQDLSADFHHFYAVCRILSSTAELTMPRLVIVQCVQRVLAQGLALLGVSAPERM
jgi:arginyl-tRNA synthetase